MIFKKYGHKKTKLDDFKIFDKQLKSDKFMECVKKIT
jgi:hypothetical protein